jgi:parallel beta-helix repeat protein
VQQNPDNTNTTTNNNDYASNNSSQTILLPTPKPTPHSESVVPVTYSADPPTYNTTENINIVEPKPQAPIFLNESEGIQAAIKALGPSGGEITLQSDANILAKDVQITSNIIFSGVNPNITLHLESKRLNVAKNAENVTIRNLTMDATNLGDRNAFVIYAGAKNVSIQNVIIKNDLAINNAVLTQGNQVEIQNLTFINVTNSHPIQIAGSDTYVKNCYSNEQSAYAFITVAGGITNVHIEENVAENRPLFDGGYTAVSSSDIWIQNNKLINFPNRTYGILVMGGTSEIKAPFDRVFVLGNNVTAGAGAYNGIAIYGLSSNIIVANNTVNQTLSAHNAIGVASGINVTVTQNTVFGCIEGAEGGIEVESNPVHNRFAGISENVNVTNNIVFGSQWGIYVRIMVPDHVNWDGSPLKSKNILIEGNTVSNCTIGINLLAGDSIIVRNNNIINNTRTLVVSQSNVLNYTISSNVGYSG